MEKEEIIKVWSQEPWRAMTAPREKMTWYLIKEYSLLQHMGFTVFAQTYFRIAVDKWSLDASTLLFSFTNGRIHCSYPASVPPMHGDLGEEKLTVFCFVLVHGSLDQEEPHLTTFNVETIIRTWAFHLLSYPIRLLGFSFEEWYILCAEGREANIYDQDTHCGILYLCSQLLIPPFQEDYISLPLVMWFGELPYGINIVLCPIFHLVM